MREAACLGADPVMFFPEKGESPEPAKALFRRRCPVIDDCLEYALGRERHGVWGGTSPDERVELERRQRERTSVHDRACQGAPAPVARIGLEQWMRAAALQHVIGTFTSPGGQSGRTAYIRPAVTPRVPWDVRAYAEKDEVFPSNPTTSQLYTGERFEAYRVLGVHGAREAIAAMDAPSEEDAPTPASATPGPGVPPTAGEAAADTTVALTHLAAGSAATRRGRRNGGRRRRARRSQR